MGKRRQERKRGIQFRKSNVGDFIIGHAKTPVEAGAQCDKLAAEFANLENGAIG